MSDIYSTRPDSIDNIWGVHPDDISNGTTGQEIFSMVPHFFYEFNRDPNVSMIYAGPIGGNGSTVIATMSTDILRNYLESNLTTDSKFCFDNLFEGNFTPVIHNIYKALKNSKVRPNQCYYFSGALNSDELHDRYCSLYGITDRINIYSCNTWEYCLIRNSTTVSLSYKIKEKKKTFLCFNRIVRPHRFALLALCREAALLKNAYYSYFYNALYGQDDPNVNMNWMRHVIKEASTPEFFRRIINNYEMVLTNLPMKLNIEWEENINYVMDSDRQLFEESYFSLVTETLFYPYYYINQIQDGDAIFLSEKTYKPIFMRHPFIIVGRPGSLKYLRKIGFKTFSPMIDESYDDIENNSNRLEAIVEEVKRLNSFTTEEWIEWQKKIKTIVDHNHRVIMSREKHMYALTRPNYENQY